MSRKFEILNHKREVCNPKQSEQCIYALTSIGKDHCEHRTRTWSFWTTFDKAIKEGLRGFRSNGKVSYEFYSEQLYYEYLVIEKLFLDYCLGDNDPRENVWFKFTVKKINKSGWVEEYGCERCDCPKEYENTVGFYS